MCVCVVSMCPMKGLCVCVVSLVLCVYAPCFMRMRVRDLCVCVHGCCLSPMFSCLCVTYQRNIKKKNAYHSPPRSCVFSLRCVLFCVLHSGVGPRTERICTRTRNCFAPPLWPIYGTTPPPCLASLFASLPFSSGWGVWGGIGDGIKRAQHRQVL